MSWIDMFADCCFQSTTSADMYTFIAEAMAINSSSTTVQTARVRGDRYAFADATG
jgi:hypothetical protein